MSAISHQSGLRRRFASAIRLAAAATLVVPPAAYAGDTWDGGGGDNNWSTANNWDPNGAPVAGPTRNLTFNGNVRLGPRQDANSYELNGIVFHANAGAFGLVGNEIKFAGNNANVTHDAANDISIANPVNLTVATRFDGAAAAARRLTLTGVISGAGRLTKNGNSKLLINAQVDNTHTGETVIEKGLLELDGAADVTAAISGSVLQIGDGVNNATVKLLKDHKIKDLTTVFITTNGVFDLNAKSEEIAVLKGAGLVLLNNAGNQAADARFLRTGGAGDGINDVFNGTIEGSGHLVKTGNNTLVLTNDQTYRGTTQVAAGTLKVDARLGLPNAKCGQIVVLSGAELAGKGTLNSTAKVVGMPGSKIAPKFRSPGVLTIDGRLGEGEEPRELGGVHLQPLATLLLEVDGGGAGDGAGYHSQLRVFGEAWLDQSLLEIELDSPPIFEHGYVVIDNDESDPVVGRFAGLDQLGVLTTQYAGVDYYFQVDYLGGDGNDVVLTNVPEPASLLLLALGSLLLAYKRRD